MKWLWFLQVFLEVAREVPSRVLCGERAPYTHLRSTDAFRQALAPIVAAADSKRAEINRVTSNGSSSATSPRTPSTSEEDSEERSSEDDSYEEED